jgi:hypothetical protein
MIELRTIFNIDSTYQLLTRRLSHIGWGGGALNDMTICIQLMRCSIQRRLLFRLLFLFFLSLQLGALTLSLLSLPAS